ncbi:MAG: chemotaxis protein CheA [bacterium]|nr:chemotaxis protein CheA [bacterium]
MNKEDLIKKIAEEFILLDGQEPEQAKNLSGLVEQLQDLSVRQEIVRNMKAYLQDIIERKIQPDEKRKKEFASWIEELRPGLTGEKAGQAPEARTIAIKDEDVELYELFLMETGENLERVEKDILELEKDKSNPELMKSVFRGFHNIKGIAKSYQFDQVGDLSHKLEDLLDLARNNKIEMNEQFSSLILKGVDLIREMLKGTDEGLKDKLIIIREVDMTRLFSQVDEYIGQYSFSAAAEEQTRIPAVAGPLPEARPEAAETKSPPAPVVPSKRIPVTPGFLKVETRKMDQLVEMIGELSIVTNMLSGYVPLKEMKDKHVDRTLSQFQRITKTIEDISLKLRMIPVRDMFNKMERIVRDYRNKSRKKINLMISGEETEMDRNMVEELYEPMVHLIRNACDHGIELPETREQAGKPGQGSIQLKAYYKGRDIVIEIADDGMGMDPEALYRKAVEKGIVNQGDKVKDDDLYRLIFHPGFSTAETVTDVSGRGVGMDVVLRMVNRFRGKISIQTDKGAGTLFRIVLPLTLAIIDGIIVRVAAEKFIIPAESVKKTFKPLEDQYSMVMNKGEMLFVEEEFLRLIRLERLFGLKSELQRQPWESVVLMVEGRLKNYCLMVDEIVGKQEIVIKSLGSYLKGARGVAGGAILNDGRIGLILDVSDLEILEEA